MGSFGVIDTVKSELSGVIDVCDTAQENVKNARGSFFIPWCGKSTQKITTINTTQINHLRGVPRDTITG
jgi:hypothetical protein